ncbi:MAG: hypothetical protein M1837_007445 [Sclerophora amabilis]|nr:MAG: hypothetical protein M1837_007445 [Sclerophora amabilis]
MSMGKSLSPDYARQSYKRSHEQMTTGRSERDLPWPFQPPGSCPNNTRSPFMPSSSRAQGFAPLILPGQHNVDSRSRTEENRSSQNPQNVIDLTLDAEASSSGPTRNSINPTTRASRPPRFAREVIDVDALPEHREGRGSNLRLPSPDVEVTFARPARLGSLRQGQPHGFAQLAQPMEPQRLYPGFVAGTQPAWYLSRGPLEHPRRSEGRTGSAHLLDLIHSDRVVGPADRNQRLDLVDFEQQQQQQRHRLEQLERSREQGRQNGNRPMVSMHLEEVGADEGLRILGPMIHLDYTNAALDMGEAPPRPRPTYDPPAPAREGFTRSPDEDDIMMCPNCEDELGSGDTEEKRSVWFVKGCGHVYCGECTKHRQKTRKGAKSPRKAKDLTGIAPPQPSLRPSSPPPVAADPSTKSPSDDSRPKHTTSSLSVAGLSHVWPLKTRYYTATIPIWIDEISSPVEWTVDFLSPAAREVLNVVGAWIVCFRKPVNEDALDTIKACLHAVSAVSKRSTAAADGILLAVSMPQSTTPSLGLTGDQWEDLCRDIGGFEYVDAEASGTRNEFGEWQNIKPHGGKADPVFLDDSEQVGIARAREALEANDWEDDEDGDELSGLLDDELGTTTKGGGGGEEDEGILEAETQEVWREMFGMREAIAGIDRTGHEDENGGDVNDDEEKTSGKEEEEEEEEDEDEDVKVEQLEAMMKKMLAVRDMGADLPEKERRRLAARTVNEIMESM